MDIFGPQFNMTNIEFSVGQTNVNYGGFDYQADKVNESSTLIGAELEDGWTNLKLNNC